jgi:hypothetical protein
MAASKKVLILLSFLVGLIFTTGCIVVPTVPHDIGVVPDKETIKTLVPGITTRADVLLSFGEPKHRLNEDLFLMYEWSTAYGYWFISYQGGAGGPIAISQYLCLEFGSDSVMVRRKFISGKFDKAIKRCMDQLDEEIESKAK